MNAEVIATVAAAGVVVLGAAWGAWRKWLRGPWRRVKRFFNRLDQTINGQEAETDAWGRETRKAILPLAEQMTTLNEKVETLAQNDARITAVETAVNDLSHRVTVIESAHQLERIAGHIESKAAFDAIGAVAKSGDLDEHDTES